MSHVTSARKRPAATSRATRQKASGHGTGPSAEVRRKEHGALGGQYAAGPVHRLAVQTKLTVGRVGDPYEREADTVAERVAAGQPAGEVSRIPAGGLSAQRREEDAPDEGAQTLVQRQAEPAPPATDEAAAQTREKTTDADKREPVQRQADDHEETAQQQNEPGGEQDAQTKCAACEREEKTQRQADEASGASAEAAAQAKCKECAAEDAGGPVVQRQADDGGEDAAQTEAAEDTSTPTEAAEGGNAQAAGGGGGSDSALGPECEPGEGGEGDEEAAGPQNEDRGEPLGCGEAGGGGEGEEAPASGGEGGPSCGGSAEATGEGGEGAGEGGAEPEAEPSAESDPDPGAHAPVPGCAESVGSASEAGGGAQQESAPTTGGGTSGGGAETSECGRAQRREESAEEPAQPARPAAPRRAALDTSTASRLIHARGAGEPLKPTVKHRLESSLGVDVEGVRVHADANAHAANRALKAKAFTHRNHIFLGAGQSQHDLNLMAHEGTHVLQQDGIARRSPASAAASDTEATEKPGSAAARAAAGTVLGGRAEPGTRSAESATPPRGPAPAGGPPAAPAGDKPAATTGPGAAREAAEKKPVAGAKREPAAAKPAAAATRRLTGAVPEAAAGETTAAAAVPATTDGAAHPGAAAAAAARLATDRRHMSDVRRRLSREAVRQKGPAATHARQRVASRSAATAASNAAPSPDVEPRSEAEDLHMKTLDRKQGKPFQKDSFLELVETKLAAMKTPATLGEMAEFKEREGAAGLKAGLNTQVDGELGAAKAPIQTTLDSPPQAPAKRKAVDLAPLRAAPRAEALGARNAAPSPRAEEEVTLEPARDAVEARLAEHRLTRERLEKANDPRFTAVQKSRETVHEHAARAPLAFRREEAATLDATKRQLTGGERQASAGMRTAHGVGQVTSRLRQSVAIIREAEERRRVATDIEGIYTAAEKKVRDKLEYLSGKDGEPGEVDRRFDAGEKSARDSFESFVEEGMSDWKLRRYGGRAAIPLVGGLLAAGTWVYDKLAGIDDHPDVVKIFDDGRKLYLSGLRVTIRAIAGLVESTLKSCEKLIDDGKKAIESYIRDRGLSPSLSKVARQTAAGVSARFDELRQDVDAQRDELADRLVDRYRESQEGIDARIKEMQAENRGLVEKFVDKVKEVVAAIRNFRNKIGPILAEAGDVIEDIIDDPIGFLGNLLDAIGRGFAQFKARIGEHLRKGVVAWLFGTLASSGVDVPKDFSARALGGLVLQVLGLTYEKLKARARRLVGPRAAGAIAFVGERLGTLFREGPSALWEQLKGDVGDLKDRILEEIKSWVITRIVTAAVKKLAMMFNPVGAIVQAVITIYHVIMFFIENIERILNLVRTVVRSVIDIVRGKIQTAADKIENALGMTIPLILSFLARLLNLGGIADKVRQVIKRVRTRVEQGITKFLRRLVGRARRVAAKGAAGVKRAGAALLGKFLPKKIFKAGGVRHTIWARLEGGKPAAVISSRTQHISEFLTWLATRPPAEISSDPAEVSAIQQATRKGLPKARKVLGQIDGVLATMDRLGRRPKAEASLAAESKTLHRLETRLAEILSTMMGSADRHPAPPIPNLPKYKLEGMVAPYAALPQAKGDLIDRDHQPQASVLIYVAGLELFRRRGIQRYVNPDGTGASGAPGGTSINLHETRHALGRTYGDKGKGTLARATARIDTIVRKASPADTRRDEVIGVLRDEVDADVRTIERNVISKRPTNRRAFGDIWKLTPRTQGISSKPAEAAKQKQGIAEAVRKQVEHGEARVKAQDVGRYKSRL